MKKVIKLLAVGVAICVRSLEAASARRAFVHQWHVGHKFDPAIRHVDVDDVRQRQGDAPHTGIPFDARYTSAVLKVMERRTGDKTSTRSPSLGFHSSDAISSGGMIYKHPEIFRLEADWNARK
ncbi:unnamed protein product [Discosporangium mesarthrocarpum]